VSEAFAEALEELYATFSAPRPRSIDGCPCCTDPRRFDAILTKPLRSLTADDLGGYEGSVFFTVGGQHDFRYLLPRLFELSASGPGWLEPETVVGALARAEWLTWRKAECSVIVAFLSAWFDRVAVGLPEEEAFSRGVEPLLCGMARADLDITPYLHRLHRPENLGGLVELMAWAEHQNSKPYAFWEYSPKAWKLLIDFLATEVV
jgi:hypothetical protein